MLENACISKHFLSNMLKVLYPVTLINYTYFLKNSSHPEQNIYCKIEVHNPSMLQQYLDKLNFYSNL